MINVTYTNDLGITNELVDANTTLRAFAEAHHIVTAGRSMDEKYTCALCGKHYDTVEERNECEARCMPLEQKKSEQSF